MQTKHFSGVIEKSASSDFDAKFIMSASTPDRVKDTIEAALNQTPEEGRRRMRTLRRQVLTHDLDKWAGSFLDALAHTKG